MSTLQNVLQYQANFHLATAATQAAQRLTVADADGTPLSALELRRLAELLRLAHLRQRFPADTPVSSPATFEFRDKVEYLQNEIDDQDPDHPTDPAEIQDVRDELDDLRANFQPTRRKT
jgi:hypothetical protein